MPTPQPDQDGSESVATSLLPNYIKQRSIAAIMERLNTAMKNEFFFEAVFLEYALLQDRIEAALRYEGNSISTKEGDPSPSLTRQISKVKTIAREKKGISSRYFTEELLEACAAWVDKRNDFVHALGSMSPDRIQEIQALAKDGCSLVKKLMAKAQSYRNYLLRRGLLQTIPSFQKAAKDGGKQKASAK